MTRMAIVNKIILLFSKSPEGSQFPYFYLLRAWLNNIVVGANNHSPMRAILSECPFFSLLKQFCIFWPVSGDHDGVQTGVGVIDLVSIMGYGGNGHIPPYVPNDGFDGYSG